MDEDTSQTSSESPDDEHTGTTLDEDDPDRSLDIDSDDVHTPFGNENGDSNNRDVTESPAGFDSNSETNQESGEHSPVHEDGDVSITESSENTNSAPDNPFADDSSGSNGESESPIEETSENDVSEPSETAPEQNPFESLSEDSSSDDSSKNLEKDDSTVDEIEEISKPSEKDIESGQEPSTAKSKDEKETDNEIDQETETVVSGNGHTETQEIETEESVSDSSDKQSTSPEHEQQESVHPTHVEALLDSIEPSDDITDKQREVLLDSPIIGRGINEIEIQSDLCSEIIVREKWDVHKQCELSPKDTDIVCHMHENR
jgi:hypothetical protein